MKQLVDLYEHLMAKGEPKSNRTGIDTLGVFGYQMRFDLSKGFPLATRKFVPFKLVASELLWFIKGEQDFPDAIKDLHTDNNHIWDEWAKPDGSFGPVYGVQWRRWQAIDRAGRRHYVDQLKRMIDTLKNDPSSRRNVVSAWQPGEIQDMALPPCHVLFQLNTRPRSGGRYLVDLLMYQRSCDAFLGVPFNIASYALLLEMICHLAGPMYSPGEFVWSGGDVHIYVNHLPQVAEYTQLRKEHPLPTLLIGHDANRKTIDDFKLEHFALHGYDHSGKLAAEVAV